MALASSCHSLLLFGKNCHFVALARGINRSWYAKYPHCFFDFSLVLTLSRQFWLEQLCILSAFSLLCLILVQSAIHSILKPRVTWLAHLLFRQPSRTLHSNRQTRSLSLSRPQHSSTNTTLGDIGISTILPHSCPLALSYNHVHRKPRAMDSDDDDVPLAGKQSNGGQNLP